MSVQQTFKAGRVLALKDVEKARKAHLKLAAKAAQFNKEFEASKAALAKAEAELKAIDTTLAAMGGTTSAPEKTEAPAKRKYTRRVPVAATKKVAAKKVAAKKTTAKKVVAKKATAKKTRQATGRRAVAEGKRPTLKAAMMQVMGNKVMSKQQVHDALKAKGWLPNSNDTLGYIGYTLSATKVRVDPSNPKSEEVHLFERDKVKGRGFYRVRQSGTAETKAEVKAAEPKAKRKYTKRAKVEAKPTEPKAKRKYTKRAKTEAKPTETKASDSNGAAKEKTADEILKEANFDPAAPFGG